MLASGTRSYLCGGPHARRALKGNQEETEVTKSEQESFPEIFRFS